MYDVIIIGSGPAGLTAGIYTHRFGLKTLILAGSVWGGQLQQTTDVENFPGFRSIKGPELMQKMRDHVVDLGVELVDENVTTLKTSSKPFAALTQSGKTFEGKTVIVATGADHRHLGIPAEETLSGRGVSYCAPCDAFFFRNKNVAVVGGGDTAMEETQVIAGVAGDTILIHRRDEFRAQQAMIEKVKARKNVRMLFNTTVIDGIGETKLEKLLLETSSVSEKQGVGSFDELVQTFGGTKVTDTRWELPRDGLFIAIGLVPNTAVFEGLDVDAHGYVKRKEEHDEHGAITYFTKTNIDGVFTAGDVHDARYKQAITAAGFGCMAALDVQRWLSES